MFSSKKPRDESLADAALPTKRIVITGREMVNIAVAVLLMACAYAVIIGATVMLRR